MANRTLEKIFSSIPEGWRILQGTLTAPRAVICGYATEKACSIKTIGRHYARLKNKSNKKNNKIMENVNELQKEIELLKKEISAINKEIENADAKTRKQKNVETSRYMAMLKIFDAKSDLASILLKSATCPEEQDKARETLRQIKTEKKECEYTHSQGMRNIETDAFDEMQVLREKKKLLTDEYKEVCKKYTAVYPYLRNNMKDRLVEFGNYLLSKERRETIINEDNFEYVTDADLANCFPEIYNKPIECEK